ICLLTGIKSGDIGNLIDANYRIIFRHLVPPLQRGWINWLEKMVEPKYTDRYENAEVALAVLRPLDVNRLPKVRISQENLAFISNLWGEKLTETITVSNPIPETILSGRWEVAAHVSDPPHTPYDHSWISFSPYKFEGNHIGCEITVDTSKLVKNEVYRREIFLHSNAVSEIETINIQVETRSLPKLEAESIFMFFFTRFVAAVFIFFSFNSLQFNTLFIWWAVISITVCALFNYINKAVKRAIIVGVLSIITVLTFIMIAIGVYIGDLLQLLFPAIIILVISYYLARLDLFILAETIKLITIPKNKIDRFFSETEQILIFPLAIGLEFSLVIIFKILFDVIPQPHCFTLREILVSAIVAIASLSITLIPLIYLLSKPLKITYKYRKSEPNLIKP
ncbi:MAG: hypothetical protein F6K17_36460, partial [Okeania sp. SIO3C4]|nr:hypothetical protein [Okeania sp. SIO3C4]